MAESTTTVTDSSCSGTASAEPTSDRQSPDLTSPVEREIALIKEKYASNCKIIKNNGAFDYIVKVDLSDYDVVIKFQIQDDYPGNRPIVILSWKNRKNRSDTSLDDRLRSLILGQNTITQMLRTAENMLSENPQLLRESNGRETKKRDGKTKTKRVRNEEKDVGVKKPSMKTATDVISRIQWDDNLQSDLFTVGYMDRFLGIVEKSFCILSWEDPASVDDYESLAIPKHRIEYFKYKEFIVWEKKSRTDYVFGSSGSRKMTIYDVMKQYENLVDEPEVHEQETGSEDSDSDDGIEIKIGQSVTTNDDLVRDDDEDPNFWRNKLRPNYFMAVRVHDPEIRSMVDYVQDIVITRQHEYETCCIQSSALHITLCTLRLDSEEQIVDAIQALRDVESDLKDLISTLSLEGTGVFNDRVLYAKVHYDQNFLKLVDVIRLALRTEGIELTDGQDFVPHMTIMKTSRPVSRTMGTKLIHPSVYAGSEATRFGQQTLDNVNLCAIEEAWASDGFYSTPLKLEL